MSDTTSVLTPPEITHFLRATTTTLAAELAGAPTAALVFHPAPGGWCAKEVVGHLIEAERRGFAGRIRIILAGNDPKLETWDQNVVATARRDCEREGGALL